MKNKQPFIIAEMSGNHENSLEKALSIIKVAAECGANAKIQTYTADTISMPGVHTIFEETSPWCGRDLYELYEEASTPWSWHETIFQFAAECGIICFSSRFDESAVDFLEQLNSPLYKVASFEINHIPLLKRIAQTKKPVLLSTGASSLTEIEEAVCTLREYGCCDLTLLKCTSAYPASPAEINLRTIPHLSQLFECEVGLSDHTLGIGVPLAAIGLGVNIIEKHFCLSRSEGGIDSDFSLEPNELRLLVEEAMIAQQALGKVSYSMTEAERKVDAGKRSIYVSRNISCGEEISTDNIKIIRPGFGLHPRNWETVLGKKASCNLFVGDPLCLSNIEKHGK